MNLKNFNPDYFMANHWQSSPCVIRQAFPEFADPLDENDLAGLAQDEEVDSRLIRVEKGEWYVDHGPFSEYESVCKGAWTLMVQGVDRYDEDVASLMRAFSFIPYWRMDDVMISFATEQAGVGPHVDQYDVFLLQGKGRRHWKVGAPQAMNPRYPHPDLSQVDGFIPSLDIILEPGDVLYIPPGWPHDGVALAPCMTYSIGFRAPDESQLAALLAEYSQSVLAAPARFTDAGRSVCDHPSAVNEQDTARLKAMMHNLVESPGFTAYMLSTLSEQHLPAEPEDYLINAEQVFDTVSKGETIRLCAGCRPLFSASTLSDNTPFTFYIEGETFTLSPEYTQTMLALFSTGSFSPPEDEIKFSKSSLAIWQVLSILINKGYCEIDSR